MFMDNYTVDWNLIYTLTIFMSCKLHLPIKNMSSSRNLHLENMILKSESMIFENDYSNAK